MTDPLFALFVAFVCLVAVGVARWFKSLERDLWRAWRTAIPAGAVSGILLRLIGANAISIGAILTVAALYVRLTGEESEPSDGAIFGAATGATTAATLFALSHGAGTELAQCLLASAVAGFGLTLASVHVGEKARQLGVDLVTGAAAMAVAAAVPLARRALPALNDRRTAILAGTAIPVLIIATVFKQWRDVKAELSHEASLGFLNGADVGPTAHPFVRLGRAGWSDRQAHRAFVRLATLLAPRKRQQRHRPADVAR